MKIQNKLFFIFIVIVSIIFLLINTKNNIESMQNKIPETISGIVTKGSGYGKPFFDYPTANIDNHENLGCGLYTATSNYGDCIVFSFDSSRLECHIKNFSGNLYNKKIVLKNIKKLDSRVDNEKYPIINIFNNGCKIK
jgi:FAD synthase